jgi:lysophospholipase L1-like esterase
MKKWLIIILLIQGTFLQAQIAPPFWQDILAFKKKDSAQAPVESPILFVGSSSFTRWANIESYFPNYPILNRAFGGSILKDVIRYSYDVVIRYRPKQVLIYCGENDLAASDSLMPNEVLLRVQTLFSIIRINLPQAHISYVSIKPSPSRMKIQDRVKAANKLIKAFIKKQKNADFIDVYDAMLDANGNMREELYVEDRLHMKPIGYEIWKKIITPYLVK